MKRKTKIILTVVLAICAISLFSAVRSSGIAAAVLGILSVAGIGFLWKKPAKQSQLSDAEATAKLIVKSFEKIA